VKKGESSGRFACLLRAFALGSLFLVLGFSMGCGGGTSSTSAVAVSVSPSTVSLALNAVQQFTATVTNDSTNRGVTWTLTRGGVACAPICGTVFPTVTPSGTPTTYTAPAAVLGSGGSAVTLTAKAVVNASAAAAADIVVGGTITINVSPPTLTLALSGTWTFGAEALNDTTTTGLTWGLSQNGTACSPGCGTIVADPSTIACGTVTPPSGGFCTANPGAATYTAPSSAPSSDTVLLTVTDMANPGITAWATITIQSSVSVSISPTYANVPVNGPQPFTATLANDTADKGVTWTLTQADGTACNGSACGTVSPTSTTSGTATTYTAPATPMTVLLKATSVADSTQTAYATIVVQPVSVTVLPMTQILYANGTAQFTATVSNDVAEKGVTWTLKQNGSTCSGSACGTISPTSTLGGVATTYTAPSSITSATTVTVTATSVTDTTKSATATVSLYPPATVTVSPTTATVVLGSRGSFTATVVNDPTNAGVTWSLTQGGKFCSPACGTVSPIITASGVATVYIAPTSMPSSSTLTLTATSNAELSQLDSATITLSASVPVARLSGSYAFLFSGSNSAGTVTMAGSFTADGTGNVTGGLVDINRASGVTSAQPLAGTYTVGPDNTGSLTLTGPSGTAALGTFGFALNATGDQARFIETDSSGTRGWGTINRQKAAFSAPMPSRMRGGPYRQDRTAATLKGDYAFRTTGSDPEGGRFVLAGRFHADGAGRISGGVLDSNDGGSIGTELPFTGSYSVSSTGRGTLTADTPDGAVHWAFYLVSPGKLLLVSTDPRYGSPVNGGEARAQTPGQPSGFTAASLRGTSVISLAGTASGSAGSKVAAGLVTFDGAGGFRYSIDRNNGGQIGALTGSGTYSVEPDGRVTLWLPSLSTPLVSYLVSPNQGVIVGTGAGASAGLLDAQAPGPFGNASLSGGYVIGTWAAPSSAAPLESGVVTSAGLGAFSETADRTATGNSSLPPKSFEAPYSVAASGRAAVGTGSVLYVISPSRAVVVNLTPGDAAGTISRIGK